MYKHNNNYLLVSTKTYIVNQIHRVDADFV